MVFSSIEFLFRFLPIFILVYFICREPYRLYVILVGSLVFYAYGEPLYILLMIGSILVNHLIAHGMYRRRIIASTPAEARKSNKGLLALSCFINLGVLFIFKYLGFFCSIVNDISGKEILKSPQLTLPLGISFYTFQIMAYVIDVYRGKYKVSKSVISFATYVSMFPQLIAGPIVNYSEVEHNMKDRKTSPKNIENGVILFVIGLMYKVLLANNIASLWNDVQTIGVHGMNVLTAWLGSWGFSFQIYFDFWGYSLMAIGLARIMNFRIPQNFKEPYSALSATEFWRRWHITLGRWFREYLYIPLGGNRKGSVRLVLNIFIVWFLTGLWHGASWNFIIWGLFFFVILILEKFLYLDKLEKNKIAGHIYMLFIIPLSWTIFAITDIKTLGMYIRKMFLIPVAGGKGISTMPKFLSLFGKYWWMLLICAFFATPIPMQLVKKYKDNIVFKIILLVGFWLSVYQLTQGFDNPFLYFRF